MSELVDIRIPSDQREGTETIVAAWLKKVGDAVSEHEPIVELSTDKVSVEVASPATGVLQEILKQENEQVEPGEVLGRIAAGAEAGVSAFEFLEEVVQ